MSEFKLLKLSDNLRYWYEVASYIAPYATVGSFILSGFSLASEHRQERRLQEISRKLDQLQLSLDKMRAALETKLNQMSLRDRNGEVLGMQEALTEYHVHQREGVLDEMIFNSSVTKSKIKTYMVASDTPLAYRGLYCGLYTTLLPLRVAMFGSIKTTIVDINKLALEELDELIEVEDLIIDTVEKIGANRVSSISSEAFLFDELGPRFGSHFYFLLDGERVPAGSWFPGNEDRSSVSDRANKKQASFVTQKKIEASTPFKEAFEEIHSNRKRIFESI